MKKKILIVDDHPDIVLMLTDRLEALGYDTISAGNGQEALEKYEQDFPHLMLLDLEMPQMAGMEVLHQLAKMSVKKMERLILRHLGEESASRCLWWS